MNRRNLMIGAMTGFLAGMTVEQKALAREYRGDDTHGDPATVETLIRRPWVATDWPSYKLYNRARLAWDRGVDMRINTAGWSDAEIGCYIELELARNRAFREAGRI